MTVWVTLAKVPSPESQSKKSPLDTTGALLVTASLACLTYSLLEWPSGHLASRVCGIVGLILLTLFVLTVLCLGLSFLYYKFADRLKDWL